MASEGLESSRAPQNFIYRGGAPHPPRVQLLPGTSLGRVHFRWQGADCSCGEQDAPIFFEQQTWKLDPASWVQEFCGKIPSHIPHTKHFARRIWKTWQTWSVWECLIFSYLSRSDIPRFTPALLAFVTNPRPRVLMQISKLQY